MKHRRLRVGGILPLLCVGCVGTATPVEEPSAPPSPAPLAVPVGPTVEELTALATNAYVYGYPLVRSVDEMTRMSAGPGMAGAAPVNTFGYARGLATPDDRFVTVNDDTLYTVAIVDLRDGPLVFHVPATGGRYYVFQFVDAWTNDFAYVGKRSTGSDEQWYLLEPPEWEGPAPEGMVALPAPTPIFAIVGRYATDGRPGDLRAVHALQDATYLAPEGAHESRPDHARRAFGDHPLALLAQGVPTGLEFWEKMRVYMRIAPPPGIESELAASLAPLGLFETESPYLSPSEDLQKALVDGATLAKARIEAAMRAPDAVLPSGWRMATHAFDFNVTALGIGTIDAPEWKIEDMGKRLMMRAAAAMAGLWGNHGYEAAYAMTFVDAAGDPLDGSHRYQITFPSPPPVDAFWSITMYDVPSFYLVANPIDRYSIGDRTPGLRRGPEGSLTIYISHEAPSDRRQRANWLPAPEGPFRPVLRMYLPRAPILDGSYVPPPIVRVGGDDAVGGAGDAEGERRERPEADASRVVEPDRPPASRRSAFRGSPRRDTQGT